MGFFSRLKSKPVPPAPVEEKQGSSVDNVTSGDVSASKTTKAPSLLSNPRVSEKASRETSRGTYIFNVPLSANKIEVRKAVEKHYRVHVMRVNMIRGEGKIVRRGRTVGKRPNWKKALVTLQKGQSIEVHQGV